MNLLHEQITTSSENIVENKQNTEAAIVPRRSSYPENNTEAGGWCGDTLNDMVLCKWIVLSINRLISRKLGLFQKIF